MKGGKDCVGGPCRAQRQEGPSGDSEYLSQVKLSVKKMEGGSGRVGSHSERNRSRSKQFRDTVRCVWNKDSLLRKTHSSAVGRTREARH